MADKQLLSFVVGEAQALFFDDSDDSDIDIVATVVAESGSKPVPKVVGYAELTVPQFDSGLFKSHFRMYRPTFDWLLGKIQHHLMNDVGSVGRPRLQPEKQLLIAIWTLANQESFR